MQLDTAQNRIIKSKPVKVSFLKGGSNTGKTTTAVYRTLFLKNNYCLYDDDKILLIAKDSTNRDYIRDMYNKLEDGTKQDYRTLFSNNIDRVEVFTLWDIINRYYFEYTNSNKSWFKIIHERSEKLVLVESCIKELRRKYGSIKILDSKYLSFLMEEIEWIKACGYRDISIYQQADRIGRKAKKGEGPARLLKSSKEREIIYKLFEAYNTELENNDLIDCEDISYLALKQAVNTLKGRFTHIIIDESQELSKTQLDFVKALLENKSYTSVMYIVNKSKQDNSKSWFIKGRKQNSMDINSKVKNYILKAVYEASEEGAPVEISHNKVDNSMESFEYMDLRHHRRFEFKRDSGINSEVILGQGSEEEVLKEEELRKLPVYSDIAAGEPIMMSNELEAEFFLPDYWIKGVKDCFMLKVKGDSMIGANIFDGDYVVLRKQHTAQNGDIVAVDLEGSATLKRLSLKKNIPVLMPENDKYDPIFLHDRQATVLGIALGVIKNK
jgi:SOS regulatory protein LexA